MSLLAAVRSGLTPSGPLPAAGAPGPDRAALLESLYREHADRIYGLCLRMCGDRAWATELAQDAFVRAWEQLSRLRPGMDAAGWLWRLATNVVLNAMRSERRRHARVMPVAEPALLERITAATPLPVRRMSIERAIARLPERARAVYVLADVEGFSHAEVASLLGIAEGTVRAHLHRARGLMREMLA